MDENTKDCEELFKAPSLLGARLKAYRYVYLKNRKKYPLPFIDYEICFLDGDKNNLRSWNLELLSPEEVSNGITWVRDIKTGFDITVNQLSDYE